MQLTVNPSYAASAQTARFQGRKNPDRQPLPSHWGNTSLGPKSGLVSVGVGVATALVTHRLQLPPVVTGLSGVFSTLVAGLFAGGVKIARQERA